MTETCEMGCIDVKLFTFSNTKDVALNFKTGIFDKRTGILDKQLQIRGGLKTMI